MHLPENQLHFASDALLLGCVDGLVSAPWLMSSLSDLDLDWLSRKALPAHLLSVTKKKRERKLLYATE